MSTPVIPQVSDMYQIVYTPETQPAIPIPPGLAMVMNQVDLTKNRLLRICHKGVEEIDSTYKSETTFESVVVDAALQAKLGLPASYLGHTILVFVDKDNDAMPIAQPYPDYRSDTSSSAGSVDLICPIAAFQTDNGQPFYMALPGRMNGPVMDEYNYLTYPGANEEIPGVPAASSSTI